MYSAGRPAMSADSECPCPDMRWQVPQAIFADPGRGTMLIGKPIGRISAAGDLSKFIHFGAARHTYRASWLNNGWLHLVRDVVGPRRKPVGNRLRRLSRSR